ncbi:MAG: FAD-dependent oxidoreductase [Planctomycetota bacterium]
MSKHKRFHLKNLDMLHQELNGLELDLPIRDDVSILGESVSIDGDRNAANRFAVQPMEGFDSTPEGAPGELSFRRYRRYAEGGSGLIWFEATAILDEARSNSKQLWLHAKSVDTFARLVERTREAARNANGHELVMVVQLTHSGRYSKPRGIPKPMIAHRSPILDPKHNLPENYPLVTDAYLDRLQDTYVEAARLAARAGFDGVDIKSCHRYLISELLASHTRAGKYGGSLENRSRLLREVLQRVREEVPEVFITTRMNVYDAIPYPYGFGVNRDDPTIPDLAEPIELIRAFRELGMPLLNVSIGNPYYNPQFGRPFDHPIVGFEPPDEHPLAGVVRFIEITRRIQQAYPELPVVAGGYSWLRHLMPHVAAGVIGSGGATLIGQGRGAFAYPDSPNDILKSGRMDPDKTCITCSGCTQIMRDGAMTGCVVRDSEIYAEQYKLGRRFALDHLKEKAGLCRNCEFATCTRACPASVDVPAFVRAFADGDIATSYDVLRRQNVLPEMCAMICPAEVQCEGGCVETILGECAIPIRDIQLVVSRMARRNGYAGVRLPDTTSSRAAAVVGGGPTGLACAIRLLEKGHAVTIFEKSNRLGGTPESIIPGTRYETSTDEVDAILAPAKSAGRLEVRFQQSLGEDVTLESLQDQFDAVFLALGLGHSMSLGGGPGVTNALEFLQEAKQREVPGIGDRVAVLGGGNTATDAAITARDIGVRDVYLVYRRSWTEMPAWPNERQKLLDSGTHVLVLTQPLGYEMDERGKLVGVRVARTELGEPDESGRRTPHVLPDTENVLPVDLVVEALGQGTPESLREALPGLAFTKRGLLATEPGSQATGLPGVFVGGDLVNGGTTAVQGIAEGMRAAEEIDHWLQCCEVG